MKIRPLRDTDSHDVDKLHELYFNFNEKPDFYNGQFQSPFAVTDDNDRIILAGGIKLIPEVAVVTDKSLPVKVRYDALLQALGCSILIGKELGHNQLYAFVYSDDNYVKILQKHGFRLMNEKLLSLSLGE